MSRVAVVGGGIAGDFAAYRLSGADGSKPPEGEATHPDVTVFEASNRIGGRILSEKLDGVDSRRAELGAMRYSPTVHPRVAKLVGELNLEGQMSNFPDDNCFLYRNGHLMPYTQENSPWGILKRAAFEALKAHGFLTFEQAIAAVLNPDQLSYISETIRGEWIKKSHALWPMAEFMTLDGAEFNTLASGMQSLPERMAQAYEDKTGGKIQRGHTLEALDYDASNKSFVLRFNAHGQTKTVHAEKVILAVPFLALAKIAQQSPLLNQREEMVKLIGSVSPFPKTKIAACYADPWWEGLGISKGGWSMSDLPIERVIYFQRKAQDQKALVMSYSDSLAEKFWKDPPPLASSSDLNAIERRKIHAHNQLMEMHNLASANVPPPEAALYQHWSDAYHCWLPGVKAAQVSRRMLHPIPELPLFICGEAYSLMQGWMEGALSTADAVLQRYFHLHKFV